MNTARKIDTTTKTVNQNTPNVRDPEHAHELAGTLGMAAGGIAGGIAVGVAAVAATVATGGAAAVAMAAPAGAVLGAAIGGALGGSAGESVAREVNPTLEEEYWSKEYVNRPYIAQGRNYDAYRPAYRSGIDAYSTYDGENFDNIEPHLRSEWEKSHPSSQMPWSEARHASRDAYTKLSDEEQKHTIT